MSLDDLLLAALERRQRLTEALGAEGTDTYRLFHGIVEGRPGLSVDRYGPLVLAQTWRTPLEPAELSAIEETCLPLAGPDGFVVWNHRGREPHEGHAPGETAEREVIASELGLRYRIQARHRGKDPWLFLDLRACRRLLLGATAGCTVLNLFSYTCGVGVCAAAGGAAEALNVDFAHSALEVGRQNAELNGLSPRAFRTLQEDFFPAARQLAGLPIKGRGARRPYKRLSPRSFDIVVLDPPRWARSPFGAVDVVRDYASLFKPALLATKEGGTLIATNHVAEVPRDAWEKSLWRAAEKAGRPLRGLRSLAPEGDFPSFDHQPPLKIAICQV